MLCLLGEALFPQNQDSSCVFMCWSPLSWTRQLVWMFHRGKDPLHPINLSIKGILRCHLVQLQLTPENIYSAETDAGTPTSCCLLELNPLKNQGFGSRFSFHSNNSQLAHISPDWPGEATVPSSKTVKFMTAVEALVGKLVKPMPVPFL